MIAFGSAVTDDATYRRVALPGIARAREADSAVFVRRGFDSIQQPYNEIMDEAAAIDGLEALVLLHQDLELTDGTLPARVRPQLRDPRVGMLGALGGRTSRPHCWLCPDEAFGSLDLQAGVRTPVSGAVEVDVLDGALLVLAPWVVRQLRFGPGPDGDLHGYDVDMAMRVGAVGGRAVCCDLPCVHRRVLKDDHRGQRLAGVALARAWDPSLRPSAWDAAFQL